MKKKLIPYLLIASILVMGMTGHVRDGDVVGKMKTISLAWASGASAALTDTLVMNGLCRQIEVDVAENTTNNITFTVAATTADGGVLASCAAIADNGSTILKATSDSTDFDAFLAAETVTVTVTPSGDPGATGATVNVGFYLE